MVEFNLLPWRVYMRAYQKTQFIRYISVSAIILSLFVCIIHLRLEHRINNEKEKVAQLQDQLTQINSQINTMQKKEVVEPVLDLVNKFQRNQSQVVDFFNQLFQLAPDNIIWGAILSQDERVILTGLTTSFQSLLDFVRSFNEDENTFHTEIIKIKSLPHSSFLQFSLQFFQVIPSLPDLVEK
jgi:Tfp pilus assembly protein PilN